MKKNPSLVKKGIQELKIAIVHDWLVSYRGGEKVLAAISDLYPSAPIYTLFCDPSQLPASMLERNLKYSHKINSFRRVRKALLPILPAMIESIPLWDYDLVISTSSCVAKGVLLGPSTKHLCYLHSPMRYIWDQQEQYHEQFKHVPFATQLMKLAAVKLRQWDVVSSQRVDRFLVNSEFVGQRVERYYGRSSTVLHPPIDVERFSSRGDRADNKGDHQAYYLVAGAFVAYKRFDLAISACERLGKRLIVAGKGEQEKSLRKSAGRYTEFVIAPDDTEWKSLLSGASALIFPGVEDFGMIAIEAMACGTPVLAFEKGGAKDFIVKGLNGEFFDRPEVSSLCQAIETMETHQYDSEKILASSRRFDQSIFNKRFKEEIDILLQE